MTTIYIKTEEAEYIGQLKENIIHVYGPEMILFVPIYHKHKTSTSWRGSNLLMKYAVPIKDIIEKKEVVEQKVTSPILPKEYVFKYGDK